jgi:MFS family permease
VTETALPEHYRRNFWCLALDFGLFGAGLAFMGQSTVIPGFLTALGASSAFIGLMSSLQSASWLLPQLFSARVLADKPIKKPYILRPAAIGRSLFLILALALWATRAQPPWLMLLVSAMVIIGFWVGDGLASVPWFDLLSKAIPPRRRGRLIGVGQVLSGVLGFMIGAVVEWMLSDSGPSYPDNYAILFALGFLALALSFIAVALTAENPGASTSPTPSWGQFIPQLWQVLRHDHTFRRFIIARQLFSLGGMATPFYMTYALTRLGLPVQVAGRYTSISVVGSILAAVIFGWINERHGTRRVMLLSLGLTTAVPIFALVVPHLLNTPEQLAWGYGLVFLCMSAAFSSMMPGWMGYVLEHAPEQERPTYVGLTNTLNGIATLFSTLGGLILQWTGDNYPLLFLIALAGLLFAWPLPFSLPEPRHREKP